MKTVLSSIILCASMAHAANHVITLGAGGKLVFSPNDVTAAVGDTLEFLFEGGNHSVSQSTFAAPCEPITGGIWSGFTPASSSSSSSASTSSSGSSGSTGYSSGYKVKRADTVPAFIVTVNATTPLWFYCAQAKHCQGGMVMGVNVVENSNKTVAAFAELAAKATSNTPYSVSEAQGGIVTSASSTSSSSGSSSSSTSTAGPKSGASTNSASMFAIAVLAAVGGYMSMF